MLNAGHGGKLSACSELLNSYNHLKGSSLVLLYKCVLRFIEVGWHAHDSIAPAFHSFVWSTALCNCMIGLWLPCIIVWLGPDYLYDFMIWPWLPCMIVLLDCDHPVSTYDWDMPRSHVLYFYSGPCRPYHWGWEEGSGQAQRLAGRNPKVRWPKASSSRLSRRVWRWSWAQDYEVSMLSRELCSTNLPGAKFVYSWLNTSSFFLGKGANSGHKTFTNNFVLSLGPVTQGHLVNVPYKMFQGWEIKGKVLDRKLLEVGVPRVEGLFSHIPSCRNGMQARGSLVGGVWGKASLCSVAHDWHSLRA